KIERCEEKVAGMLGITSKDLIVGDLKVNPASGNVYLSASRGRGTGAAPVLLKIDRSGKVEEFATKDVKFAKLPITDPAGEKRRTMTITSLGYADGKLIIAGLSNEEFTSKLRVVPFPFDKADAAGTGVEIFHGSHGRLETNAPIRTFTPFEIGGQANILASYTCTPIVKVPL